MNRFKLLSTTLIAGVLIITACKKDNPEDPETKVTGDGAIKTPTGKSCLLTTIEYDGEGSTIEYDANGKISKVSYLDEGKLGGYTTYSYEGSKLILKEYEDGVLEGTETYNLINGLVSTSTISEAQTRGDSYTYTRTKNTSYEHNADGYLTKQTTTYTTTSNAPNFENEVETDVLTYTYQNGNLASETWIHTRKGSNGTEDQSYTYSRAYEYYTDKANTVANEDMFFLTKANKNLIKKLTETDSSNNTYSSNFTYEINADGLVTKSTEVYESGTEITTYQYNCK